jgi:hypothetical protein
MGIITEGISIKLKYLQVIPFVITWLPPFFLFSHIVRHRIVFPFWDYWEQVQFFYTYSQNGLFAAIQQIINTPLNETRPIFPRLILFFNGVATDWDIESEYKFTYIILSIATIILIIALKKVAAKSKYYWLFLSILTIFVFSPAAHGNLWWSWPLLFNLNFLLTLIFLFIFAFSKKRKINEVILLSLAWIASFTLTNGLLLFPIIMFAILFTNSRNRIKLKRLVVWLINFILILFIYLKPIANSPRPKLPDFFEIFNFALSYIGNPLFSIITFQYQNPFEPHSYVKHTTVIGIIILTLCVVLIYRNQRKVGFLQGSSMLLFCCTFYSLASGILTAIGRVNFDTYGVQNANSSRFVQIGTVLYIGLIFHVYDEIVRSNLRKIGISTLLITYFVLVLFSFNSHKASSKVFLQIDNLNYQLAQGFKIPPKPTEFDSSLYPNQDHLNYMRLQLYNLKLGPYSNREDVDRFKIIRQYSGDMKEALTLNPSSSYTQLFRTGSFRANSLAFPLVTWGTKPSELHFKIAVYKNYQDVRTRIYSEILTLKNVSDWQKMYLSNLNLEPLTNYELRFSINEYTNIQNVKVGVPLFSNKYTVESFKENTLTYKSNIGLGLELLS